MTTIAVLDSLLELHAPAADLAEVLPVLPPSDTPGRTTGRITVTRSGRVVQVIGSDGVASQVTTAEDIAGHVLAAINRLALAQCRAFAVHAGVVARDDRVVVVPAASGAGKSTLVAALLLRGWRYVSDEALVIVAGGTVRSYPRPLALQAWSLAALGLAPLQEGRQERRFTAEQLGSVVEPAPGRVTDVVLLRRAGPAGLWRVPRPDASAALLRHSFNHYRDPAGAFTLVTRVTAEVRAWELAGEDPQTSAARLDDALADPAD